LLLGHGQNGPNVRSCAPPDLHSRFQLVFGDQAIHQPKFQRAFRRYRLTRQHQLERNLWTDQVWQNCDASGGNIPMVISGCANRASDWRLQVSKSRQLRAATDRRPSQRKHRLATSTMAAKQVKSLAESETLRRFPNHRHDFAPLFAAMVACQPVFALVNGSGDPVGRGVGGFGDW